MPDDPQPGQDPEPQRTPEPAPTPEPDKKPPWGDDKDFDAEKAWKLLQAKDSDKDKLRERLEALEAEKKKEEDAKKSEGQKLQEALDEAKRTAGSASQEAARLRVALKKGLTETQAKRLVGESEEELEADADDLLASFKQDDDDEQDSRRRPTERLRPGAAPSADADPSDPKKLAEQVPRGW